MRPAARICALVTVAALAIRAGGGVVLLIRADNPQALSFPDEQQYWLMAQSLADGEGLRDELGFRAARMPLYPAFLSIFARTGVGVIGAKVVQWILGGVTAGLAALLAMKIWDHKVGLVAGLLVAFDPFLNFFSSLLLTETLFTFGVMILFVLLWPAVCQEPAGFFWKGWIALGVVSVLCVHTRESAVVLVVLTFAVIVVIHRGALRMFTRVAVVGAIVFASLVPWAIRNRTVTGSWCFLTFRGGISLYDGVGPRATGASDLGEIKQMPAVRGLSEPEWDRYFRRESWSAIRSDPSRVFRLAGTKLRRTWNPFPNLEAYRSPALRRLAGAWTIPTFALAFAGAVLLVFKGSARTAVMLLVPSLYVSLLHSLFVGSVRYRIVAVAFLHLMTAYAMIALVERVRPPRRSKGAEEVPDRSEQLARRRFRLSWRKAVPLFLMLAALIGLTAAYLHYTNPQRIQRMAEKYLIERFGGAVNVGSASFSWSEGVCLNDVSVSIVAPGKPSPSSFSEPAGPSVWLQCPVLQLRSSLGGLLRFKPRFETLTATEPIVTLVCDPTAKNSETLSLLDLLRKSAGRGAGKGPTLDIQGGRLRVLSRSQGTAQTMEELTLNVRGRPADTGNDLYDLIWEGGTPVLRGHARIDLRTGTVTNQSGGLPWLSTEAVLAMAATLDPRIKHGSGRLAPRGRVRVQDFALGGQGDQSRAVIQIDAGSFSIPIHEEENSLPPAQRYLEFEQVAGTTSISHERIETELTGAFHGNRCVLMALATRDAAAGQPWEESNVEAAISLKGMELPRYGNDLPPAQKRFIDRVRTVAIAYRDYDPGGPIDLELTFSKPAGKDQRFDVRSAAIIVRGASASSRFFPYRVNDLTGSVQFDCRGFTIGQLCGTHKGGGVCVEGRVDGVRRYSPANIRITGTQLPLDGELHDSLPEAYQRVYDWLDAVGYVDVNVILDRPSGTSEAPPRWQHAWSASFNDLSLRPAGMPGALENVAGQVLSEDHVFRIRDVRGALADGRFQLNGSVVTDAEGLRSMDVQVETEDAVLNESLASLLPSRFPEDPATWEVRGDVDVHATIGIDPGAGNAGYHASIRLADASLRHDVLPGIVDRLNGYIEIDNQGASLRNVTGCFGDADLKLDGFVGFDAGPATLHIRADHLTWTDAVRALQETEYAKLLDDWVYDGGVFVDTRWRGHESRAASFGFQDASVRADGVTVFHPRLPLPLQEVRADLRVDAGGLTAERIKAKYGQAALVAALSIPSSAAGSRIAADLVASGLTLDKSLRAVLPAPARGLWDRLDPAGRVDVSLHRFDIEQHPGIGPAAWTVEGGLDFHDAEFGQGPRPIRLTGSFQGKGRGSPSTGTAVFGGVLDASMLEVVGLRFREVQGPWAYDRGRDGRGQFIVDSWDGRLYEGACAGRLEVMLAPDNVTYSLSAMMDGVELQPLAEQWRTVRKAAVDSTEVSGRIEARLRLSGRLGDPAAREGMGSVNITEARVFRTPLFLAILNVINLSMPEQEAFDEIRGEFYVLGDRIEFGELAFRGKGLTLVGAGGVSLPDGTLDLRLVQLLSHRWPDVPLLTDIIEGASRELVAFHVTGTLARPVVRPKPLQGLTDEFKSLLQRKKNKPVQPIGR